MLRADCEIKKERGFPALSNNLSLPGVKVKPDTLKLKPPPPWTPQPRSFSILDPGKIDLKLSLYMYYNSLSSPCQGGILRSFCEVLKSGTKGGSDDKC